MALQYFPPIQQLLQQLGGLSQPNSYPQNNIMQEVNRFQLGGAPNMLPPGILGNLSGAVLGGNYSGGILGSGQSNYTGSPMGNPPPNPSAGSQSGSDLWQTFLNMLMQKLGGGVTGAGSAGQSQSYGALSSGLGSSGIYGR